MVLFFSYSLIKEETQRPKYNKLLEHAFIRRSDEAKIDVAHYVSDVLDNMANNGATMFTMNQPWKHALSPRKLVKRLTARCAAIICHGRQRDE